MNTDCVAHDQHRPYRLSCADYQSLVQRAGGRCEVCRTAPFAVIDHDHAHSNAHVRGLLCRPCNTRLGQVDRRERSADTREVAYLTRAWHLTFPPGPPPTRRRAQVLQAARFDPVKWTLLVATCERLGINPSDALREGVDLFLEEHDG